MAEGRVTLVPGKKFAFIEPGHVFQHLSELPPGVTIGEGDTVEYEADAGQKGLRVKPGSLKLKAKADPSAPAPVVNHHPARANEPAATDRQQEPQVRALRVSWGIGRLTDDGKLPVEVFLKYGMDPAIDQPVQLLVNARKFGKLIYPEEEGSVEFLVPVPADANKLALHADISGRLYARVWHKEGTFSEAASDDTATEPAAEPQPVKPLVEKLAHQNGVYTFRITANPNTVVTTEGIRVKVPAEIKTDGAGIVTLELEVEEDRARGYVHFCARGLQSDPQYVVHRIPPTLK